MRKTYQITQEGKKELEVEIETLKSRRGEIADKIAEARDYGDLSENAEYDSAREEQGIVESRIAEIEDILLNAEIIKTKNKTHIHVGSTVALEGSNGKNVTFTVVGPVEADPINGKISDESPLGSALMGKTVGEEATITTPKGTIVYTIRSIE